MKKIMSLLLVLMVMVLFSVSKTFADMESASKLRLAGDFKGALAAFQDVLKASPNDVQAQRMEAICQINLEQDDAAMASFSDVVDNPSAGIYKVEAQWYRGDILMRQKNLDEALVAFNNAITLGRASKFDATGQVQMWMGNALISSGDILASRGKVEEAQVLYLQVCDKGTDVAILRAALERINSKIIGEEAYLNYLKTLRIIVDVSMEDSLSIDVKVKKAVTDKLNFLGDVKFKIENLK